MANQSAKKNEQQIRLKKQLMIYSVYALAIWLLAWNVYFLWSESISVWSLLFGLAISGINHFCCKQTIKCWEYQLPAEASEYYLDIWFMNSIVSLLDPYSHKVRHIYWAILVFVLWKLGGYLWDYITPKYEEADEEEGKKEKKEKKEKIKYVRK